MTNMLLAYASENHTATAVALGKAVDEGLPRNALRHAQRLDDLMRSSLHARLLLSLYQGSERHCSRVRTDLGVERITN